MRRKSIACISLLFIGYGITYLYLDYQKGIEEKNSNEELLVKYYEKNVESNNLKEEYLKKEEYIAVLEIPKINFKRGLFSKKSHYNDLDKNIVFLDKSDMPHVDNSRVIIAGHSGDTSNSYFKFLYKLKLKDTIHLYFDGFKYTYKVSDIYEIKKTGQMAVESNTDKKTLTLVTCKGSDKQLVIISTLQKEKKLNY